MNPEVLEAWEAFKEMRKAKGKRAPFTLAAEKRIGFELRRLQADGHDPAEVLWQSVINGWSGVFPVKGRQGIVTVPVNKQVDETAAYLAEQAAHRAAIDAERQRRKTA